MAEDEIAKEVPLLDNTHQGVEECLEEDPASGDESPLLVSRALPPGFASTPSHEDRCRLCNASGPEPLIAPCNCLSAKQWVHRSCLNQARFRSMALLTDRKSMMRCKACKYRYEIRCAFDLDEGEDTWSHQRDIRRRFFAGVFGTKRSSRQDATVPDLEMQTGQIKCDELVDVARLPRSARESSLCSAAGEVGLSFTDVCGLWRRTWRFSCREAALGIRACCGGCLPSRRPSLPCFCSSLTDGSLRTMVRTDLVTWPQVLIGFVLLNFATAGTAFFVVGRAIARMIIAAVVIVAMTFGTVLPILYAVGLVSRAAGKFVSILYLKDLAERYAVIDRSKHLQEDANVSDVVAAAMPLVSVEAQANLAEEKEEANEEGETDRIIARRMHRLGHGVGKEDDEIRERMKRDVRMVMASFIT